MSHSKTTPSIFSTGLAMFCMFFGAGNVIFPLAIGQYAQDNNFYAILGLLITAVGVPFLGLISMTLFNGNYKHFFERIGKVPGFIIALAIMGLIGPFGATPRCIALSYSTVVQYFPWVDVKIFTGLCCLLIFACTYNKTTLVNLLGKIFTPFLILSLGIIIVMGLWYATGAPESSLSASTVFLEGLNEGYQTMDLVAAFFFSSVVISCLEPNAKPGDHKNYKKMVFLSLKASAVGAFLLSLAYIGFCLVASNYSVHLNGVPKDRLIGALSHIILGPSAGIVAIATVALACLTTAMALASVFADFLSKEVTLSKLGYVPCLVITLVITYFIATLEFAGIAAFLVPILQIAYPALITLSGLNIAHKLYHFNPVKVPVLVVFVISLVGFFLK